MGKITVEYKLSDKGQKASLLSGGNGERRQQVDASNAVGDLKSRIIDLSYVQVNGDVHLKVESGMVEIGPDFPKLVEKTDWEAGRFKYREVHTPHTRTYVPHPEGVDGNGFDAPQDLETLVAVAESLRDKRKAHEDKRQKMLDEFEQVANGDLHKLIEARDKHREKRREQEKKQEEQEAREAEVQAKAMEDWIREHGSERLKLILEEGFLSQSMGVYRDERLAQERPGWQWDAKWHNGRVDHDDVINPSLEDLQWLRQERQALQEKYPNANPELCYGKLVDTDEYGYDDEHPVFEGTFLVDEYMNRTIVLVR
jgi:hypothetical protein